MNTQTEKEIIKEEKELIAEVKKEEKIIAKLLKDVRALVVIALILVVGIAGAARQSLHRAAL